MNIKVFVDGQEGTTGLMIHKRLLARPDVQMLTIDPALRKDPKARAGLLNEADMVFLCLPDEAAKESVSFIQNPNTKVLDASTAHRVAPGWVYGFPELSGQQRRSIAGAHRVAVPGCHASGFIALVRPLVDMGLIPKALPLSCHSVTGYTGGGKKMIAQYEDPNRPKVFDSPRMYALKLRHKHLKEMRHYAGLEEAPLFDPIVGDFPQGMMVSVPLFNRLLPGHPHAKDLHAALSAHYAGQRFVKVMPFDDEAAWEDGFINAMELAGTNDMQIFVLGHEDQTLLVSRFDNLGKGASGAAVQCMNIMMGCDEAVGLE